MLLVIMLFLSLGLAKAGEIHEIVRRDGIFCRPLFATATSPAQQGEMVKGIDVSVSQGDINWQEVYNAGLRFAFVKATAGDDRPPLLIDDKFEENMTNGRAAGLLMAPYHFAYAGYGNAAADEARFFVNVAGEYLREGYLRPALDVEDDEKLPIEERNSSLGPEALSAWVREWMETVQALTGVEPILYVSSAFAREYLTASVSEYDVWIAHWRCNLSTPPDLAGKWDDWAFWQYYSPDHCGVNQVPGVDYGVDLNVFNGDEDRLGSYAIPSEAPRIAVTEEYYDKMQEVLDLMGRKYTTINPSRLEDQASINAFDFIFINCAADLQPVAEDSAEAVRQYVQGGGIVYASDFAFTFLENSFPGYVDFVGYVGLGDQYVAGDITDSGLAEYLGMNALTLYFDLPFWVPIESVSPNVRIYVEGDVSYEEMGETVITRKPIVVGFRYGEGAVVYTSFHNAAQGELAARLMEYLALLVITEDLAQENRNLLENAGYTVMQDVRGMIDQGETLAYQYQAATGETFKVILNWPKYVAALLRLAVYDPTGASYDLVESSVPPISVSVVGAKSTYTYELTAIDTPYENLEYAVEVGKAPQITPPPQYVVMVGPNPVASEGCVFWLDLPEGAVQAKLMLFNISGRLVFETPIDTGATRFPSAGTWDPADQNGSPLANGPYVYILIADGKVVGQGKMVIQR